MEHVSLIGGDVGALLPSPRAPQWELFWLVEEFIDREASRYSGPGLSETIGGL